MEHSKAGSPRLARKWSPTLSTVYTGVTSADALRSKVPRSPQSHSPILSLWADEVSALVNSSQGGWSYYATRQPSSGDDNHGAKEVVVAILSETAKVSSSLPQRHLRVATGLGPSCSAHALALGLGGFLWGPFATTSLL